MNVNLLFYKMFWTDLYYNTKWGIWAILKYFKIVWKMRPWSNTSVMEMLKFQLEILHDNMDKGYELREHLDPKLADIKRCVELINNHIEDNYVERLGGLNSYKYPFEFKEIDKEEYDEIRAKSPDAYKTEKLYELIEHRTEEEIKEDHATLDKSRELEESEWQELWNKIKGLEAGQGLRSWWN